MPTPASCHPEGLDLEHEAQPACSTLPVAVRWLSNIPDTPCMPCLHWGGLGQCRHIWHTWSVWVWEEMANKTQHIAGVGLAKQKMWEVLGQKF